MKSAHTYIMILGRYPELSYQEIASVLKHIGNDAKIITHEESFLLIQSTSTLPVEKLNKKLGGTVKIGKVLTSLDHNAPLSDITDYLTSDNLFTEILENPPAKMTFGVSYYHKDKKARFPQSLRKDLLQTFKNHLEAQGFTTRYPRHEGSALSSASVAKNKLLTQGVELLLVHTENELLLGKTLAVQEFEEFSKRDYGRPSRDMESGIMPPKIARMMINLSEIDTEKKLLDPFCGSGTLVTEAMILGFTNITGTDISPKAIEDTKANIEWLKEKMHLVTSPRVEQCDVRDLPSHYKQAFDAVVGEPYMGPNLQEKPQLQSLLKQRDELEKFYLEAFQSFASILHPHGVVVMILPIFHHGHQYIHMDILEKIEVLGFEQIPLRDKKRKSLIVGNSYDFVLREIVKWRKR